jgi:hypothetical protein
MHVLSIFPHLLFRLPIPRRTEKERLNLGSLPSTALKVVGCSTVVSRILSAKNGKLSSANTPQDVMIAKTEHTPGNGSREQGERTEESENPKFNIAIPPKLLGRWRLTPNLRA